MLRQCDILQLQAAQIGLKERTISQLRHQQPQDPLRFPLHTQNLQCQHQVHVIPSQFVVHQLRYLVARRRAHAHQVDAFLRQ